MKCNACVLITVPNTYILTQPQKFYDFHPPNEEPETKFKCLMSKVRLKLITNPMFFPVLINIT